MKIALPVALVAFALGCIAGVMIERRHGAAEATPAAPAGGSTAGVSAPATPDSKLAEAETKAAAATAELVKAKEQIAKLEKAAAAPLKPGEKAVLTPEEAKAKAEELKARIPDLVAKKDGKALIALMKELASLGEPGFMAAIEISGILSQDVEGGKSVLGISKKEFYMAFGGPMVPVMLWSLQKGDEIPAGFRIGAAYALPWQPDIDGGRVLLDALKNEKNPDVARALSDNLDNLAKPGMEGDVAALVPSYLDNPRILSSLMDSLVKIGSDEALASLQQFARSDNEALRNEAEISMIAIKPPAAGILITMTVPNSQAENIGIKRGDIITGYNGAPIEDFDALREQMKTAPAGSVATVSVNRRGEIITLQVKAGAKLGIDGKDVKPK